jgi:hypothetical protein
MNKNIPELHKRRVQEQTEMLLDINEVWQKNVGTVDVTQAFLNRPIEEHNNFCLKPARATGFDQEYEPLKNVGILAVQVDPYDALDSSSKKGVTEESNEESSLFSAKSDQNLKWSHCKPAHVIDNVNWTHYPTDIPRLISKGTACRFRCGQALLENKAAMWFQAGENESDEKVVMRNNQDG